MLQFFIDLLKIKTELTTMQRIESILHIYIRSHGTFNEQKDVKLLSTQFIQLTIKSLLTYFPENYNFNYQEKLLSKERVVPLTRPQSSLIVLLSFFGGRRESQETGRNSTKRISTPHSGASLANINTKETER